MINYNNNNNKFSKIIILIIVILMKIKLKLIYYLTNNFQLYQHKKLNKSIIIIFLIPFQQKIKNKF